MGKISKVAGALVSFACLSSMLFTPFTTMVNAEEKATAIEMTSSQLPFNSCTVKLIKGNMTVYSAPVTSYVTIELPTIIDDEDKTVLGFKCYGNTNQVTVDARESFESLKFKNLSDYLYNCQMKWNNYPYDSHFECISDLQASQSSHFIFNYKVDTSTSDYKDSSLSFEISSENDPSSGFVILNLN